MFFAIKCMSLKMLRTVPTLWIIFKNEVPHCWIPKTGYTYKLKNLAPPPHETDVKAREEWYFSECEILFGKAFQYLNDGEMALSKLIYDPEWYYKDDAMSSNHSTFPFSVKEAKHYVADNSQLPSNVPAISSNNSIEPCTSSEGELPADSSDNGSTELRDSTEKNKNPTHQELNENEHSCLITEDSVIHANSLENESSTSFTLTVEVTEGCVADNSQLSSNFPALPSNKSIEPYLSSDGELLVDSSDNGSTELRDSTEKNKNPTHQELSENEHSGLITEDSVIHADSLENESSTSFTSTVEVTEGCVADNSQLSSNFPALSSNKSIEPCTSSEGELPVDTSDNGSTELHDSTGKTKNPTHRELNENEQSCLVTQDTVIHTDSFESESSTSFTSAVEVTEGCVADNSQLPSNVSAQMILSDWEQYNENKRLCKLHNFEPPIHYSKFEKLQYAYVRTFNVKNLRAGNKFETLEELSLIRRKYDTPFCRPGPVKQEGVYDWYLVDSIVQEVHLKNAESPFFVVRWVGYEDEYNTVEPLANVKHTAVHKLFTSPNLYTACRFNGCVLRRSQRKVSQNVTVVPLQIMDIDPSIYESTMNKLIYELRIEEKAGRYSPDIGFCSYQSVAYALVAQHRFLINKFCPMLQKLESPVYLDQHYIGPIFGTLGRVAEFRKIIKDEKMKIVDNTSSLKDYISRGFSNNLTLVKDLPRYVSFVAIRKFDTDERKDKTKPNFHMCVFTVKCHGLVKDAIYYDPSPKYFARQLPPVLENLATPVLESFTHKFGDASEKDDCTFQCMRYIIGLATGDIPFEPDTSEPCRKIDKFKATKKMNSKRSQKIDESDEAENAKKIKKN